MNKKNFEKLILDSLDGDVSPEEELFLEEECWANRRLAEERESYREVISLLQQSETITSPSGFTERVMAQIEKKPVSLKQRIFGWIRSPLDVHLNWAWKWSMVFSLVFLIWAGVSWQNFRLQQVYRQVGRMEQHLSSLKNQPIPTRFFFYSPTAKSVHLVGSFNNWQTEEKSQLVDLSRDGIWSITLLLEPGKYEYMYLVDGKEWVTDPGAMESLSDGFGHKNSILEVVREMQI